MKKYGILVKSDRAIAAEEKGLVTYSKLQAWQKRAVDRGVVRAREWHHTSGAANKTNYYNLADFEDLDSKDFQAVKKESADQADLNRLEIVITYQKMVGGFSSRRKKFESVEVRGLDIRKKDNIIIGAGGRRLDSNNDSIRFFYKKPRAKAFKEITKTEAIELGYRFI